MAELGLEDGSVSELGLATFVLMVELGLDEAIFHPNCLLVSGLDEIVGLDQTCAVGMSIS